MGCKKCYGEPVSLCGDDYCNGIHHDFKWVDGVNWRCADCGLVFCD